MNKTAIFPLILFSLLISSKISAQGFYLRLGGGLSGQAAKTEYNDADPNGITGIEQSTDITVSADGSSVRVKSLNGSLGAGYKLMATGGYMFNPYIGAELGINYFKGNEERIGRLNSPSVRSEEKAYIEGLDLMPAILITPGFSSLNPYLRAGLIMTGAGKLMIETDATQVDGGGTGTDIVVKAESEVKSHFSIGYMGALGVMYPLGDQISLFGEVEFKAFSIKSKSAEIKKYTTRAVSGSESSLVPGQQLEDLPVNEKKFTFEDSYTQSTSGSASDEPAKVPTQYVNASGAGVNLGLRFAF